MQNKIMKLSSMLLGACCLVGGIFAREIRAPLPFTTRGYNHYPLPWPANDDCTNIAFWAAGDHRSTDKAFSNKNGTTTTGLSTLYFGAETFFGSDLFGPDVIVPPALIIAEISPRFDYSENAAVVGVDVYRPVGCNCQWNLGFRAMIPFRAIKVTADCCPPVESNLETVQAIQTELVQDEVCVAQPVQQSFAYRLDFLAALPQFVNQPSNKLFHFGDGITPTSIGTVNITQSPPNVIDQNPVNAFRNDPGVPPAPFAMRHRAAIGSTTCPTVPAGVTSAPVDGSVSTLPDIGSNGTGVTSGNRGRFLSGTDYTPLSTNIPAQRNIWIVPTASTQAGGVEVLPANLIAPPPPPGSFDAQPGARSIQTQIENIIAGLNLDSAAALSALGINFASQRRYQVGDLFTEIYVNRYWCNYFGEAAFGVRFPTGRQIKSSQVNDILIAQTPTGNNRHFELRFGGILGWDPVDWFAMRIDGYYNVALKRKESVAAAFQGMTIKNIGPAVDANVNWQYFLGDVDFTFMVPCISPELGFDVGYQFYWKSKDHISFDQTTAIDFLGNTAPLEPEVLENNTSQLAHRVKLEFFQTVCGWEIFGGFMHTFAGKNITRDSDWYLGMKVYF